MLDHLIDCAARQNLSLREAGFRILEARAQLGIAEGNFFPQVQTATAGYQKSVNSGGQPPNLYGERSRHRHIYASAGRLNRGTFAGKDRSC